MGKQSLKSLVAIEQFSKKWIDSPWVEERDSRDRSWKTPVVCCRVNWEKRGFRFSRSFYAPENASRHVSTLCLQFVWLSWMLIRWYSFLRLCKCFWSVYN